MFIESLLYATQHAKFLRCKYAKAKMLAWGCLGGPVI